MRLESSNDMGDPREISCSSGTMELMGQAESMSHIAVAIKYTFSNNLIPISLPGDHFCCHGADQVPEMPQETCIES